MTRVIALEEQIRPAEAFPADERSTATTLINNAAAGSATGIDTRGYDEALIMLNLTSISGAGTLDIGTYFGASNSDAVAISALTGASFAQKSNGDDGVFVGRVKVKNQARYLYVKAVQATAASKKYAVSVLLSKADSEPVSQANTVEFTV